MSDNARFHNKLHRKNHHSTPTTGYPDSATDPIASYAEPFQGDFVINGSLSASGSLYTTFYTLSNISILNPVLSSTVGFNPTNSLIVQLSGANYAIPISYIGNKLAPTVITNSISGVTTFYNGVSVIGSLSGVDSINWNNISSVVITNSASWNGGSAALNNILTNVSPNSAFWQGTYSTVAANSGLWTTGVYVPIVYTLNQATSAISPVLGNNTATGLFSNIAGGSNNQATNAYNTVLGGYYNVATGLYANVAGGWNNTASGSAASIAGGYYNCSGGTYTTVVGGCGNRATNYGASVIGGWGNVASGNSSSVGGGLNNTASGFYSSIAGGVCGTASGTSSNVNGGLTNTASGNYSVVGGGKSNTVTGNYSGILGGLNNSLSGCNSFIIGSNITANANNTTLLSNLSANGTICGNAFYGDGANVINVLHAVDKLYTNGICTGSIQPVSGSNTTSGCYSVIGGGQNNGAQASWSAVLGGNCNTASSTYSLVGGGYKNCANNTLAVIVGGSCNTASGYRSSVVGGYCNTASGIYSSILGGICNDTNSQINTYILGSCIIAAAPNTTFVNNLSTAGSVCAGLIYGDGTNMSTTTYLYGAACGTTNTSIVPKLGSNIASGAYSFIAAGSANDTKGFSNTFILGSSLSATQANYTYVNNIKSTGIAAVSALYVANIFADTNSPGSVAAKMPIYDSGGTLVGYIPIYTS